MGPIAFFAATEPAIPPSHAPLYPIVASAGRGRAVRHYMYNAATSVAATTHATAYMGTHVLLYTHDNRHHSSSPDRSEWQHHVEHLSRVSRHLCHAIGSNLEESLSYGFLSFDVRLHLIGHERRLQRRRKKKGRE